MNVITTSVLRDNLADAFEQVTNNGDYLLVAKKGKITSAIVNIDFFEDLIALTNKKYIASVKKARQEYEEGSVLTHGEVFGSL